LIAVDTEVVDVPAGAIDELRTFGWGVVGATDPYGAVQTHLREVIRLAGVEHGRIGYEGSFEAVAPGHMAGETMVPAGVSYQTIVGAAPDAKLVDATTALHAARARKTHMEIAHLRLANEVAALGLDAFCATYEPGRTEAEVAAQIEAAIMSRGIGYKGARHARSWAQLMTGPDSARAYTPHPATSARVIERGDLGLLELATVVDGYWSDLTRTLVAGVVPSARQEELYAAVLAAHDATMRAARPGMTGAEVDALARGEIERRGLGAYFLHHTGHGLGFRYHEPHPFLHPMNEEHVEEGMVSSIEPGLYLAGFGGLRLEENVVFTASGVELLSVFPTALTGAAARPRSDPITTT
jgi:Xaa-Pro dipeptidase